MGVEEEVVEVEVEGFVVVVEEEVVVVAALEEEEAGWEMKDVRAVDGGFGFVDLNACIRSKIIRKSQ
ncbi:hypothetical protein CVT26_003047 [Gymnopilus dilepis]|uniref:Uncharacterized protein n=1 Tax=Gymnopilus dilepis TaxID=231916 RepID=A0A409Y4X7_9AGAR|nr:hypothetical protein CVT26_003047 [Gymnopilus dilepis]